MQAYGSFCRLGGESRMFIKENRITQVFGFYKI